MPQVTLYALENRLARLTMFLLMVGVGYGVVAGAVITMYYEAVPAVAEFELSGDGPLLVVWLLTILTSLIHVPLAFVDLKHKLWNQAAIRLFLTLGLLFVILGLDGLVSHFLWWGPLSTTGRYHLLHHSLFAGVPLTIGYWLARRRWWRPETFVQSPVSASKIIFPIALALGLLALLLAPMMGLGLPVLVLGSLLVALALLGLLYPLIISRTKKIQKTN